MTSGVFAASAASRSWFSTAAPPTSAAGGQVGAQPVDGRRRGRGSTGRCVGTAWISTRLPSAAGSGRHDRGDARVRLASAATRRRASRGGRDDLQGAGGARAEGGAGPGRSRRREASLGGTTLIEGIAVFRPSDGAASASRTTSARPPKTSGPAPEPLAPGGEARRAVLAGVHPGQGELVDPRAELASTAGSRVRVAASTKTTESMIPTAIERNAGDGTSITAESEISTVAPENSTALPAVSIVSATASSERLVLSRSARRGSGRR